MVEEVPELGSGISLEENFDLNLDTTGDIDSESGIDELQKDLAVATTLVLKQYLGEPPEKGVENRVSDVAKKMVENDVRVNRVVQGSVEVEYSDNRQELSVEMSIVTEIGTTRLIVDI